MSLMSTLMYTIMALPVILMVLALLLKRRQSSYPSWRDVDPAVLKVGGSAKKLEAAADADVIVIGSGLGGLTSAAVLSKAGFKVVVLEQHDVIGGATHTFEDGGFEFDVGIHYLGGAMDTWLSPVRRLWAAVSDNKLEWTYCDPNFDVCHNASSGESIPFCGKAADNDARIAAAESLEAGRPCGPGARPGTRPGAVAAALRAYRRAETLAHLAGAAMVAFKALPPAALRLAWPLLAPLWRKYGCATVAEVCAACGMSGELASLTGVVSYLYGDYGVHSRRKRRPAPHSTRTHGASRRPDPAATEPLQPMAMLPTIQPVVMQTTFQPVAMWTSPWPVAVPPPFSRALHAHSACLSRAGVHPARAPMFLHALVSTHYNGGAFFPTGGSSYAAARSLVCALAYPHSHQGARTEALATSRFALSLHCSSLTHRVTARTPSPPPSTDTGRLPRRSWRPSRATAARASCARPCPRSPSTRPAAAPSGSSRAEWRCARGWR